MKFKNKEISRTQVKNNILKTWSACDDSDKFDWYLDAHVYANDTVLQNRVDFASDYHTLINKFIGYLAALSPLKRWDQNKKLAADFYLTGTAGHMSANVTKCRRILCSGGSDEEILSILNGNKICAFYLNIKYYDRCQNITIDRHALSVALGYFTTEKEQSGITKNQYEFFVQCYLCKHCGYSQIFVQQF